MNGTQSENTTATAATPKVRTPRLALYHPSGTGGGAALQLELRLNRPGEDRYDCFFLELAAQKSAAGREGDRRVAATFDWENKVTVKLDFADVCELLTVLEGRTEHIGGQRNGLYHENGQANTVISFQKSKEKGGYFLGLSRKGKESGQVARAQMLLSEPEAIGLRCLFQTGLFFMTYRHALGG
jgi:hypothetical protein